MAPHVGGLLELTAARLIHPTVLISTPVRSSTAVMSRPVRKCVRHSATRAAGGTVTGRKGGLSELLSTSQRPSGDRNGVGGVSMSSSETLQVIGTFPDSRLLP